MTLKSSITFLKRQQSARHVMATEPRRRSERIRAQSSSQEDEARLSQVRAAITKNASFFSDVDDEVDHVGARQPTDVPEFTIGTLRKAIPAHCFERRCVLLGTALPAPPSPPLLSLAPCSLAQLASFVRIPRRRPASDRPALRVQHEDRHPRADVDTCVPGVADGARESRDVGGVLVFSGRRGNWYVEDWTPCRAFPVARFRAYSLTRSLADSRPSGVWVIAHECGHQAFSKYQSVNDGIGLVLHSLLLVPYYSWKFSHARHHSNTGSVAKDEVFVPAIREDKDGAARPFEQFGPLRLVKLIGALTLGWPAVRLMSCS